MSSGSVTISYTTIAEVALVAALVGGIAYIGSSKSANAPHPTHATLAPQASAAATKKPAAKNKKKKPSSVAPAAAAVVEPVVEVATAVKDHVVHAANSVAQQPAVKQAVQQAQKVVQDVSESVSASTEPKKKASKKNKGGNKTAPAPELKPDATKHAEQKVKSGDVGADMVDPEVNSKPQVARVMKVVGGKAGAQANGYNNGGDDGWERADAFDDDEGGWESVVSKKPSRPSTPSLANGSSSTANDRVVPGMPAAALTKKQRENANKKAKEQSLKEQQNREQEDRLREYRREQEKAKLAADQAARARQRPKSQNFFGAEPVAPAGSSKVLSGGMTASLDPSTGSLVWE